MGTSRRKTWASAGPTSGRWAARWTSNSCTPPTWASGAAELVAWTGVSSRDSTGSAVSSTFMWNTYGAFTSRANHVMFTDDLFENNELDGLRLHRNTVNSTVTASAAVRNGGNGFVVSRGATFNVIRGDLAVNNRLNGFLINGQSLVTGASPSGGKADPTRGIA